MAGEGICGAFVRQMLTQVAGYAHVRRGEYRWQHDPDHHPASARIIDPTGFWPCLQLDMRLDYPERALYEILIHRHNARRRRSSVDSIIRGHR